MKTFVLFVFVLVLSVFAGVALASSPSIPFPLPLGQLLPDGGTGGIGPCPFGVNPATGRCFRPPILADGGGQ
jgi:hypothetical protein